VAETRGQYENPMEVEYPLLEAVIRILVKAMTEDTSAYITVICKM
jgi:hypothetical protein